MQFALQRLGHEVFAVPTILLGYHKGYSPPPHQLPLPPAAIAGLAANASAQGAHTPCDAVLSGYAGTADAAHTIASHVSAAKTANPALIYLCDPVLGDNGALYVGKAVATAIRDELAPLADILTPNRFELGWLTGREITDTAAAIAAARSLDAPCIIVTSAPPAAKGEMATLLVTADAALRLRTPRLENPPHGTGDLMAALFLAHRLDGAGNADALRLSVCAVHDVLEASIVSGKSELALIAAQDRLAAPKTQAVCEVLEG